MRSIEGFWKACCGTGTYDADASPRGAAGHRELDSGHQVSGRFRPAGHRPLHRRMTTRQAFAPDDGVKRRGHVPAPPRIAAARRGVVRGGERLEARGVADLLERREERDGEAVGTCLLYTSDAADDLLCVDLGGRRIIKKKK